jgi:hypothetical protein
VALRSPKKFESTSAYADLIRETLREIFPESGEPRGNNCFELIGWALRRPESDLRLARWLVGMRPSDHETAFALASGIAFFSDTFLQDHKLLKIVAIQTANQIIAANTMALNADNHRLISELIEDQTSSWLGDLIAAAVLAIPEGDLPELDWLRELASRRAKAFR